MATKYRKSAGKCFTTRTKKLEMVDGRSDQMVDGRSDGRW